jgi:hypothetical protein
VQFTIDSQQIDMIQKIAGASLWRGNGSGSRTGPRELAGFIGGDILENLVKVGTRGRQSEEYWLSC